MKHETDIDLENTDAFDFDESPNDFVNLETTPIVFTIRGLRYFTPRFRKMNVSIGTIKTKDQFQTLYRQWVVIEAKMLLGSIAKKAERTHQPNEHKVLLAALTEGLDAAQYQADRLAHAKRANLKLAVNSGSTTAS